MIVIALVILGVVLAIAGFAYNALFLAAVIPWVLALGIMTMRGLRPAGDKHLPAETLSDKSQQSSGEHYKEITESALVKLESEIDAEDGTIDKVKAAGHEVDRQVGGVYESRDDGASDT